MMLQRKKELDRSTELYKVCDNMIAKTDKINGQISEIKSTVKPNDQIEFKQYFTPKESFRNQTNLIS